MNDLEKVHIALGVGFEDASSVIRANTVRDGISALSALSESIKSKDEWVKELIAAVNRLLYVSHLSSQVEWLGEDEPWDAVYAALAKFEEQK